MSRSSRASRQWNATSKRGVGALRWLLLFSLALNFAGGAAFVLRRAGHKGGQLGLDAEGWRHRRIVDEFEQIPGGRSATIFLGDSLIAEGPWSELFPAQLVLNRGIKGDTIAGLRSRLHEITRREPRRIVLLIGINDLVRGRPVPDVASDWLALYEDIKRLAPKATVTALRILPTRRGKLNDDSRSMNRLLDENAELKILDTWATLTDEQGLLQKEFTYDGIHLTIQGYLVLAKLISQAQ